MSTKAIKSGPWKPKNHDTMQSQKSVNEVEQKNELMPLLMRLIELQESRQQKSLLHHTGIAWMTLWRIVATHALVLLLGMSGVAYWMLKDDSWKSYIQTGCNPSPMLYSERFIPEPVELSADATIGDLLEHREDRITQLTFALHNALMDRDSIRAVCGD